MNLVSESSNKIKRTVFGNFASSDLMYALYPLKWPGNSKSLPSPALMQQLEESIKLLVLLRGPNWRFTPEVFGNSNKYHNTVYGHSNIIKEVSL